MKQKILDALKNEYKNLGLGEKAFGGVAAFLEKTITKEEDILSTIQGEDVKAMLKAFQGETDVLRNAKAQAEKALNDYKASHPDTDADKDKDKDKDKSADDEKYNALMAEIEALKNRNAEADKQKRIADLTAEVRNALKRENRGVDAILNLVLGSLEVADDATVETLTEAAKTSYDTRYSEFYGNGAVPPAGGHAQPEGYKKGQFAGVIKSLQENGSLEKTNN